MYTHILLFHTTAEAERAKKAVVAMFPLSKDTTTISNDGSSRDIALCFSTETSVPLSMSTRLRGQTSPTSSTFNTFEQGEGEEGQEETEQEAEQEPSPEYGMGATLCLPNDRYPFTIIAVEQNERGEPVLIAIQRDQEVPTGEYPRITYTFERQSESRDVRFVRRKKTGEWRTKAGMRVVIGSRSYYRAPEF